MQKSASYDNSKLCLNTVQIFRRVIRFMPPPFVHNNRTKMYNWTGAQNLRLSIVMKPSINDPVSWMGSGSFVNINIFSKKYFYAFICVFRFLKLKSAQMHKPKKGNSEVSLNNTLLNFRLEGCSDDILCTLYTVHVYSVFQ